MISYPKITVVTDIKVEKVTSRYQNDIKVKNKNSWWILLQELHLKPSDGQLSITDVK